MKETKAIRDKMPDKDFAGPGESYPVNDPEHARLALSGASHAEHVGNISKSEEASIDAKAHAALDRFHHADDGHPPPSAKHGRGPRGRG